MKVAIYSFLVISVAAFQAPAAAQFMDDLTVVACGFPARETSALNLLERAAVCLKQERMSDATALYYAGFVRLRCLARLDRDATELPATLASLRFVLGTPIVQWAGGDVPLWAADLQRAIRWDASTSFRELDRHALSQQRTIYDALAGCGHERAQIKELRAAILADPQAVYRQRREAGLAVRDGSGVAPARQQP